MEAILSFFTLNIQMYKGQQWPLNCQTQWLYLLFILLTCQRHMAKLTYETLSSFGFQDTTFLNLFTLPILLITLFRSQLLVDPWTLTSRSSFLHCICAPWWGFTYSQNFIHHLYSRTFCSVFGPGLSLEFLLEHWHLDIPHIIRKIWGNLK